MVSPHYIYVFAYTENSQHSSNNSHDFFRYIIPESPRWLLAKGRTDELIKTIEQAAQLNKLVLPENYKHCLSVLNMKSSEKVSFFAIFRTKYLRTSVVLFIFWLCLMQIYNGTTLELGKLSKNIYTSTVSFMYIYMHFITSYNPKMVYKLPQGIH